MTLEKFKEEFNGAPLDWEEFAEAAEEVTDCPELAEAAKDYLEGFDSFQEALQAVGVEIG